MPARTPADIVGIGQCCWDILLDVDRYPEVDAKRELLSRTEQGGGPVATALVTLARLGVPCRFHGIVGDDDAADKIRGSLLAEGIDISGITARQGGYSQQAYIVVERETGRRTIFWQRPGGAELRLEELGVDFLEGARGLLLDGLMAEVSLSAARKAKTQGVTVMLDAGRLRPGILEMIRHCDYLVAAEQFAIDMGWSLEPEAFGEAAERTGAPVVTVTRGDRGSITWRREEGVFQTPAFPVAAIDTTGAGDVFHGGYLYGVLQGWPLSDTIRFASACAAIKCTKSGGRAGIPNLQEVMSFLQSHDETI